jgi:hypothetical protein
MQVFGFRLLINHHIVRAKVRSLIHAGVCGMWFEMIRDLSSYYLVGALGRPFYCFE